MLKYLYFINEAFLFYYIVVILYTLLNYFVLKCTGVKIVLMISFFSTQHTLWFYLTKLWCI